MKSDYEEYPDDIQERILTAEGAIKGIYKLVYLSGFFTLSAIAMIFLHPASHPIFLIPPIVTTLLIAFMIYIALMKWRIMQKNKPQAEHKRTD